MGAYFLALQVAQCAQSVLASVQHFIPQDAPDSFLAQHLLPAQPTTKAEAQTIRARNLSVFIFSSVFNNVRRPPGRQDG